MAPSAHPNVEHINAKFSFADNPIIVKAESLSFSDGSIFRQVIVEVTTYYDDLGSTGRVYLFSINVNGDDSTIACDVSSAIRSTLASYEYDATTANGEFVYPNVRFRIKMWAKEMKDGVVSEGDHVEASALDAATNTSTKEFYAYLGGLSDRERWLSSSTVNTKDVPTRFSTKPSTGEFMPTGCFVTTTSMNGEGKVQTTLSVMSSQSIDSRKGEQILFVNSRGVYETISIVSNESEEYDIETEVRSLVGATSYRPSPSIISHKEGGGAVWKMSSGYVNKEWAQWYAREFLMAKHYWLRKDGLWLPVAITPDSGSVMTYDKNDPSLVAVNFTVMAAIKG